jgi:hypothetical protein
MTLVVFELQLLLFMHRGEINIEYASLIELREHIQLIYHSYSSWEILISFFLLLANNWLCETQNPI